MSDTIYNDWRQEYANTLESKLMERDIVIAKLEDKNAQLRLALIEIAIGINIKGRSYTCAELRKIAKEAIEEADEK